MISGAIFQEKLSGFAKNGTGKGFLTAEALVWYQNGQKNQISLDDVVGVSTIESGKNKTPCLIVNTYPLVSKGKLIKKRYRVLKEYCFTCPDFEVRSRWQRAINNTLQNKPIDAVVKPRHLQIIVNPNSGKQQASQILERVLPLFEKSYLKFTVKETSSGEDTQNFVKQIDLSTTDGLVILGGDGTIHDAIAGLMARGDRERAIKTPIGVIPGGTGNGLCKTLLELSGEAYDPLNAAFLIAKGKQQSCDLACVEQNGQQYYSFLSLAWGLISDVDIESEKLQFLGSFRFDIYALMLIFLLRTYKGRFSFIPDPNWQLPPNRAIALRDGAYKLLRKPQQRDWTWRASDTRGRNEFAPRGLGNLAVPRAQKTDPPPASPIAKDGEWYVIEDEFIFLWAMNIPWAAHDMNVTPHARLNDGLMDVLVMRKPTSRIELLTALLRCGQGKHLSLPHMEYYKVRSFRLEPLTNNGILVVDGEPVDYSPIEMQVIPGLATVSC